MTGMLVLARRNLKFLNREMEYLNEGVNEDDLVNACFHTHMIIELALKHLLEVNGLPSNFTHQLKTLIKMCKGYELPIPEEVTTHYIEMKDWDTETLYNIHFEGDFEIVQALHPVLNKWLKELEK
ncbi:HEPN domain-containing protein [Niameybacter massiliensis]|uniref:HEPN domain-containing protein n=1 Tax=Holtiella tumoricola TaxID=3018743 RepID=A0AA42DN58_9FIRM|nr:MULTISPECIES: HEPN domain-containing protein [Lachnospirales]MDA3731967.1 HEPN domain-containing protein [Holtiella tumoricola]